MVTSAGALAVVTLLDMLLINSRKVERVMVIARPDIRDLFAQYVKAAITICD